jgi:hypothetical protein
MAGISQEEGIGLPKDLFSNLLFMI